MSDKKRVWCLYRVSTMGQVTKTKDDDDMDRVDIPMQRKECREFAALHPDWEITKEVDELGVSGFKKSLDEREKLMEIKDAAVKKQFDVLLVFMFDRIGRRTYETPLVVKFLVDCGVEVWSVKEGQRKLDTNVDELMCIIDSWVANNESRKTSMRISAGKAVLAELGYFSGGYIPFGKDAKHIGRTNKKGHPVRDYVINSEEALVLEGIYHALVDEGYGAHSICKSLNDRGIRSKTGNYWRATTLRSLVANEANLGYVKCKGVLYGPFEHLRVIDDYYFTKANDMIHARAPKHKKDFNGSTFSNGCQHGLLKGLVFCGECGGRMTIAKNRSKRYRADGTPVVYETNLYRCYKKLVSSEHKGKTGYKAEPLEEHVLAIVRDFFSKIKHTPNDEMLNAASQRDASIQHLAFERAEKAYKKAEDDLMKLKQEAIKSITGDGKLSLDVIDGLIKSQESTLQSTREVYENAKQEVEALEDKANLREAEVEHLMSWADAFDSCTIEQKRTIIAALVDKVTLKGDNIEVEMTLHAEQFLQSAS